MLLKFAPPHKIIIPHSVIDLCRVVRRQLNWARPVGGRGTCEAGYLLADENRWRRGDA